MNKRPCLWPQIAAALIVSLAVAVTWSFAGAWFASLASQLWWTSDNVNEQIMIRYDGIPVIQSYSYGTVYEESYRTLDGKPVDVSGRDEWLTGAYFAQPMKTEDLLGTPISWSERLASSGNFQRPQTGWYLVRDDQPIGHAYLIGYDEASRLRVGYIGRNGFRLALPPREEWFDVGENRFSWGSAVVCSSSNLQFGARANVWSQAAGEMNLPPWLLFLIDGNRLLEIDLRARSVRNLLEMPGMLAAAIVYEPSPSDELAEAPPTNPRGAVDADTAELFSITRNRLSLPSQRVAIQMADRIVILDPPTGNKREYLLPKSLRNRTISVFSVADDQLLVQWSKEAINIRNAPKLTWLKPDGAIAREESVALAGPPPASERQGAWVAVVMAPVPIMWLLVSIMMPLAMMQSNQVATYAEGLAKVFADTWPAVLALIAVGIVLTWLTYHLQCKYRRPATGTWAIVVFLLGVPGFLAYWLEQRRAKLESCKSCGEIVPRDRDACAACDTQFPAPPLVGTEIFA